MEFIRDFGMVGRVTEILNFFIAIWRRKRLVWPEQNPSIVRLFTSRELFLLLSSSLWQLSPPCLPHTLPCQKCSSSIHPPFLSQCNVNVGGWRCDALIILQKVFRCGRQSRLMKQSWRWDRLWSEVEIQSFNNWSKVQHFESSDPERLKNWGIMKQGLNKVGLFDKVSTILK